MSTVAAAHQALLEDLEARLDPAVEDDLRRQWRRFLAGEHDQPLFTPQRQRPAPTTLEWPQIRVNQAMGDEQAMALQQLGGVSATLAAGSGAMLGVRCNYGVGILPTLFGARLFLMEDEQDCLPNVHPLDGGQGAIEAALEAGVPDLHGGLGGRVFAMAEVFQELLAPYPKLQRYVALYHPDLQGPMDICELLWGSDIFMALVDQPDRVHAMLRLIVDTYRAYMEEWRRRVPPADPAYACHWDLLHRGQIVLRDDSAMNLSPPMVRDFIVPYDQELLSAWGGGCIHFCGRGSHYIHLLAEMDDLYGVNMSQPHYNDLESIYTHTVDRGIPLLGFDRETAEAALAAGRDLHHLVHCR